MCCYGEIHPEKGDMKKYLSPTEHEKDDNHAHYREYCGSKEHLSIKGGVNLPIDKEGEAECNTRDERDEKRGGEKA
jgi:hypothetical protein